MADHEAVAILPVADNLGDAELTMRVLKKHNPANRLVHVRDGEEALDFMFARGAFTARKGPPRW